MHSDSVPKTAAEVAHAMLWSLLAGRTWPRAAQRRVQMTAWPGPWLALWHMCGSSGSQGGHTCHHGWHLCWCCSRTHGGNLTATLPRSATETEKGPLRQAEDNRRFAADLAARIRAVQVLQQRLREEQRDHDYAKQRIKALVHERAGLGAAQPPHASELMTTKRSGCSGANKTCYAAQCGCSCTRADRQRKWCADISHELRTDQWRSND